MGTVQNQNKDAVSQANLNIQKGLLPEDNGSWKESSWEQIHRDHNS